MLKELASFVIAVSVGAAVGFVVANLLLLAGKALGL